MTVQLVTTWLPVSFALAPQLRMVPFPERSLSRGSGDVIDQLRQLLSEVTIRC